MKNLATPQNTFYALIVCMCLLLLNTCNGCRNSSATSKNTQRIEALDRRLDSMPTNDQLNKAVKIEGLESSKRTLYDWNAVVRTAVRPDDRMNQYDQEIKSLKDGK